MSVSKRIFDVALSLILLAIFVPLMLVIVLLVLVFEGRPIFYLSERMRTSDLGFTLIKFRTMQTSDDDAGVTGGEKMARVSRFQKFLRRSRLDELPQLFNILRGEMSFVGPRPPLRTYVEDFPEIYKKVLQNRPGVTGLASLKIHRYEDWVLSGCKSSTETDLAYRKRCIPKKAKLDLIYAQQANLCLDMKIITATVFDVTR